MEIETKFDPGQKVFILRPPDWNWMDIDEFTNLLAEEGVIQDVSVDADGVLDYRVFIPKGDCTLDFMENELYKTEEAAKKAALRKLLVEEDKEKGSENSVDKDFLKVYESALGRIEKKLDLLIEATVKVRLNDTKVRKELLELEGIDAREADKQNMEILKKW